MVLPDLPSYPISALVRREILIRVTTPFGNWKIFPCVLGAIPSRQSLPGDTTSSLEAHSRGCLLDEQLQGSGKRACLCLHPLPVFSSLLTSAPWHLNGQFKKREVQSRAAYLAVEAGTLHSSRTGNVQI